MKTVVIPNVEEEARIGISFNHMIKVIAETETVDDVCWDFKDVNFLHPFFLAPLAIYALLQMNCATSWMI